MEPSDFLSRKEYPMAFPDSGTPPVLGAFVALAGELLDELMGVGPQNKASEAPAARETPKSEASKSEASEAPALEELLAAARASWDDEMTQEQLHPLGRQFLLGQVELIMHYMGAKGLLEYSPLVPDLETMAELIAERIVPR